MKIGDKYETLEKKFISLINLTSEEKEFLNYVDERFFEGINYLSFKHIYREPNSLVFANAKRLGRKIAESPLFLVCDDLAKRLGIKQGYLRENEILRKEQAGPSRELTTGEVAKMAGCSPQAVQKAILTWRLPARKVGRISLIWEKDAEKFALSVKKTKSNLDKLLIAQPVKKEGDEKEPVKRGKAIKKCEKALCGK